MQKLLSMFKSLADRARSLESRINEIRTEADVSTEITRIEGEINAKEASNKTKVDKSAKDRAFLAGLLGELLDRHSDIVAEGSTASEQAEADPEGFLSRVEAVTGTAQNGDVNVGLVTRFGRTAMNVYRSALDISGIAEFTNKAKASIQELTDRAEVMTGKADAVAAKLADVDALTDRASEAKNQADSLKVLEEADAVLSEAETLAADKDQEADGQDQEADGQDQESEAAK